MYQMYSNVGSKIKSLVKIIVGVGMAASVLVGIVIWVTAEAFLLGLLIAGLGCFASWLSGLVMYAYGEMADCLQDIRDHLLEKDQEEEINEKIDPENIWKCYHCGRENVRTMKYCTKCGTNRDWSDEKWTKE